MEVLPSQVSSSHPCGLTQALGVEVRFGSTVKDLLVTGSHCRGIVLQSGEEIAACAVILAVSLCVG